MIFQVLYFTLLIFWYILIARIILSWAPMIGWNVNWYQQPFKLIDDMTETMREAMGGDYLTTVKDYFLFTIVGLVAAAIAQRFGAQMIARRKR